MLSILSLPFLFLGGSRYTSGHASSCKTTLQIVNGAVCGHVAGIVSETEWLDI